MAAAGTSGADQSASPDDADTFTTKRIEGIKRKTLGRRRLKLGKFAAKTSNQYDGQNPLACAASFVRRYDDGQPLMFEMVKVQNGVRSNNVQKS